MSASSTSCQPKTSLRTDSSNLIFRPSYRDLDLVCFSHLRWDFVFQRPQHLLTRFAKQRRVFVIEEPIRRESASSDLEITEVVPNLWRVVPRLSETVSAANVDSVSENLLKTLFSSMRVQRYLFWIYTPMVLPLVKKFKPSLMVYDCMDELSNFHGAPKDLKEYEADLFQRADLVFTGGRSLYEKKCVQHPSVHLFPSSVDVAHFATARENLEEPSDQKQIAHPRIGFSGVIDERMDLELLREVARQKTEWQLVLVGPVVKIEPATLPQGPNLHYLGMKNYQDLPKYLAGWEVAMLPFARNDATRFISPTKTPEYLAAGKRVVSTSIRDVVHPYSELALVQVGDAPDEFIQCIEYALQNPPSKRWLASVDQFLSKMSWNATWKEMDTQMSNAFLKSSSIVTV